MRSRAQFTACYNQGERFFSKNFVVFARLEPQGPAAWQMGSAVTKKCGNAPQRNRIKRVLREFIRLHQEQLPPHVRLVIVPKRHVQAALISLRSVAGDLTPVLGRLTGLLTSLSPGREPHSPANGEFHAPA